MDIKEKIILKNLAIGAMLTSREVEFLVCNYDYETELADEPDRWTTSASTIIETEDGKFYELYWYRGNTEMQENEYPAQYAKEVEPYEETIVVKKWRPVNG